jgi:hypothetical protein
LTGADRDAAALQLRLRRGEKIHGLTLSIQGRAAFSASRLRRAADVMASGSYWAAQDRRVND